MIILLLKIIKFVEIHLYGSGSRKLYQNVCARHCVCVGKKDYEKFEKRYY